MTVTYDALQYESSLIYTYIDPSDPLLGLYKQAMANLTSILLNVSTACTLLEVRMLQFTAAAFGVVNVHV